MRVRGKEDGREEEGARGGGWEQYTALRAPRGAGVEQLLDPLQRGRDLRRVVCARPAHPLRALARAVDGVSCLRPPAWWILGSV